MTNSLLGAAALISLVLFTLKLIGVLAISWWAVVAPVLVVAGVAIGIVVALFAFAVLLTIIAWAVSFLGW